jgi:hypothetical protein
MRDAGYRLGLISNCLQRSRTSLRRWFDRVPNLAAGDNVPVVVELPPVRSDPCPVTELEERYCRLRAVLEEESDLRYGVASKPQNLRELQEAVAEILEESRRRINGATSEEEAHLRFRGALSRIKALL